MANFFLKWAQTLLIADTQLTKLLYLYFNPLRNYVVSFFNIHYNIIICQKGK